MTSHDSWPLDSAEHLTDALLEQGIAADEAAELTRVLLRLTEWQMPAPTAAETTRLLAQLTPLLPTQPSLNMDSATVFRPAALRAPTFQGWERIPKTMWASWLLLWHQIWLIHRGLWLATVLCIIGITLYATVAPYKESAPALTLFLPIITAGGIAFIYGRETDSALEVALATPTSPRAVLLGRVALFFSFNLALGLVATALVAGLHGHTAWAAITLWLGPAALLSSGSLLLSLLLGPFVAVGSVAAVSLAQVVHLSNNLRISIVTDAIWQTSPPMLALAAALLLIALLYVPRQERLA